MSDYHTLIIGAGSGGITVAAGVAGFGKKVALVERKHVGGDCTNVGCVPSKTLIHLVKQADARSPAEILAMVRERRTALRDEEHHDVANMKNVELIMAEASFVDAHTVALTLPDGTSKQVTAEHIVIAAGSKPILIPIDGLPEEKILTNESLFDLDDLPEHLVIVGAGIIGSEMAFAFRKLGANVSLVDLAPRVLSVLEPDVSELMQKRMQDAGIKVYLNAKGSRFDNTTNTLHLDQQGTDVTLTNVSKVLLAIGRKPALESLKLERAGVKATKRGIETTSFGRTNIKHIFAIGDVNPSSAFTHSANAQGRRVVPKITLPWLPMWGKEPVYPSATFTEPEVAQVGPPLAKLHERYHPALIKTYKLALKETDRGYTQYLREEDGFVLMHATRLTGKLLSATIVAPEASEMIPVLTLAIRNNLTLYALANLVFPYPVLSEAIKKSASSFVFETLPNIPQELLAYLRYRWAAPEKTPS